jgi:cytosine/adenosine deaminase-related metal-dependent hydrolase
VVRAAGDHATLIGNYPGVAVEELRGKLIAPGFVDMHVHYPQTDVIGAPDPVRSVQNDTRPSPARDPRPSKHFKQTVPETRARN